MNITTFHQYHDQYQDPYTKFASNFQKIFDDTILKNDILNGTLYEKRKHILLCNSNSNKQKYDLAQNDDRNKNLGISNLKISGDYTKISHIILCINGTHIDDIYPSYMGYIPDIDLLSRLIVPICNSTICLYVTSSTDVTIEYDIMTLLYPSNTKEMRFIMEQNQFNGDEPIGINSCKYIRIKMCFRSHIQSIIIKVNKPISDPIIDLDGFRFKFLKINNETYALTFDKPINFSNVDNDILIFTVDVVNDEGIMRIFAKNINVYVTDFIYCGLAITH
jgi:hypothetical protein